MIVFRHFTTSLFINSDTGIYETVNEVYNKIARKSYDNVEHLQGENNIVIVTA